MPQNALDDVDIDARALEEGCRCVAKGVEVHPSWQSLRPQLHSAVWASSLGRVGESRRMSLSVRFAAAADVFPAVQETRSGKSAAQSFVRPALELLAEGKVLQRQVPARSKRGSHRGE